MSNLTGTLKNKNGDTLFPEGMQVVTNSNGTALKFPDGTLICYNHASFQIGAFTANSLQSVNSPFTFPVAFVDNPVVLLTTADNSTSYVYGSVYAVIRNSTGISMVQIYRMSSSAGGEINLHYIALGRWK